MAKAWTLQGGTGHWPVLSGDPPDGTGEALCLPAETVSHSPPGQEHFAFQPKVRH